ncbi:MAG: AEC family transporter [Lachnospiraceae bacterium]|nr:AEC family transporter [Lachnospiraceae bacterium]
MEISILLFRQICSLVLMGLAGFWLRKMNFIHHEGSKGISAVVVYICIPCTLFMSFQTELNTDKMAGFLYALTAVFVLHVLFFAATWLIQRFYPLDGIERTSIIYSNCGNLIIPLVTGIFGAEYIFYTSASI